MSDWLRPVRLEGRHAALVPLAAEHVPGLVRAASDGELWRLWFTTVPRPEDMAVDVDLRLEAAARGEWLPFTVLNRAGDPVGVTAYLNVDAANRRVEIGGTWYARSAQRTGVNTECKLMLLRHAFETLDCIAVEFRTHRLNARSRRAIERLGAQLDGILRNHRVMPDGTLRDTAVYSITAPEWPTVRSHLEFLLRPAIG
ncbi:MAG: GNAT family protein [Thermoleophilia bacterium]